MNLWLRGEQHPPGAPIFRGGLIVHSTGSGKTVVGLGIVMEYLKLHQSLQIDRLNGPYICIVTLKSNKDQNGLERYLKNLQKHYPRFVESMIPGLQSQEETARMIKLRKEFESRIRYFSFIEFASCLGLYGSGRDRQMDANCNEMRAQWKRRGLVVIIDEAHELTKANLQDRVNDNRVQVIKNEYQAILRTKEFILKSTTSTTGRPNPLLHVYALTATPGSPQQTLDTINMVRPSNLPKVTEATLHASILSSFVSFADLRGNTNLFARVDRKVIVTPVHPLHYAVILYVIGHIRKEQISKGQIIPGEQDSRTFTKFAELHYEPYTEKTYLKQSKTLQDILPFSKTKTVFRSEYSMQILELVARWYFVWCSKNLLKERNLQTAFPNNRLIIPNFKASPTQRTGDYVVVAPKLISVVKNAVENPGKHYIYTSNAATVEILGWLLRHLFGFTNITNDVKRYTITNASLAQQIADPRIKISTHKNFIAMKSPDKLSVVQNFMSGIDMVRKNGGQSSGARVPEEPTRNAIKRNIHGQNCKIVIMTGELFTGVDINALRGVHLVEPFASVSSQDQAEGRAARARGHAFLNESNRNATVYLYQSSLNRTPNTHWTANMMTKSNAFLVSLQKDIPSEKGIVTDTTYNKIKMGREWLDSVMRKPSNTIRRNDREIMNYNQILYPTPDEVLRQEREKGTHSKQMRNFIKKFQTHAGGASSRPNTGLHRT